MWWLREFIPVPSYGASKSSHMPSVAGSSSLKYMYLESQRESAIIAPPPPTRAAAAPAAATDADERS